MSKETKKSDLQKKLESEGWEFFTSESRFDSRLPIGTSDSPLQPFSDYEIKEKFSKKGFKDVMVSSEAYDTYGSRIYGCAGVYVKR